MLEVRSVFVHLYIKKKIPDVGTETQVFHFINPKIINKMLHLYTHVCIYS